MSAELKDLLQDLTCYCDLGRAPEGSRQVEVEKRLAARYQVEVGRVHALLDLQIDVLDGILDIEPEDRRENELEIRMAGRTGLSIDWLIEFDRAWEEVSDAVEREAYGRT